MVEGYAISYGITMSDLRRTHMNLVMNQRRNRENEKPMEQDKD